ncbi:hypothetical protein AVEN_104255-1 [Araneus ventricosus]|uniref:HTH CENPB-type domain-containing protein n=1 Tax=Araneus ventricosus TaxID=182803 RepID=A0A4Y2NNM5_ARAVE|nr:hypothetical protein AVEN_104255-1 [Araneus ventricosus]
MIQQKALNFNSKLGESKEFQASSGWLEKFKNRHGNSKLRVVGEKLSSDIEAVNSFIAELQDLIVKEKLTADQIYNCDETGLYWRADQIYNCDETGLYWRADQIYNCDETELYLLASR